VASRAFVLHIGFQYDRTQDHLSTDAQSHPMDVTAEQRSYARFAGVMFLAHMIVEMLGDYPTIIARGGETFAQTSRYVIENATLWRTALLAVGIAWIMVAVLGFALYVVLEPVNKRLAQVALLLRLGGSFVGAGSLMFRVAKGGVQLASASPTFTTEQLGRLAAVTQQGANAGVYIAWILIGLSSTIFFLLFMRSRYLPRALAGFALFGSVLLVVLSIVMFVHPPYGTLKPLLITSLLAELATALWLVTKGLRPHAAGAARVV
jgi:hypothetical protein